MATREKREQKALEAYFGSVVTTVEKQSYNHCGLDVFNVDDVPYAVGWVKDTNEAVSKSIRENLWAFNADFICGFIGHPEATKGIAALQEKCHEDCNEVIYLLIRDDFEGFVQAVVEADGRGQYLSSYDGREINLSAGGKRHVGMVAYRLG